MSKLVNRCLLFISTIRYLKFSQVYFQFIQKLKRTFSVTGNFVDFPIIINTNIYFDFRPPQKQLYFDKKFRFLNLEMLFEEEIDWNFMEYGKLWNYNLEYFDYLQQQDITVSDKKALIYDFYEFSLKTKRPLEPYPVSLRAINIIRFTIENCLEKQVFHEYLYQELTYLNRNYEFHLLGNHLLENAFALCLGGAFFSNHSWHDKAIRILTKELQEQILPDGAHFELSPMYHKIIFFRLLEMIDWYSNYEKCNQEFLEFCREKASLMRSWLENITFENGDIPLFNDAARGIAFSTSYLIDYAEKLNIYKNEISLGASGYRSFKSGYYEIKIDCAAIGASYQPGHAHADSLSFILYYQNKPLFVEQGTSTYQIGSRRNLERSTQAHNTVVVNNKNQSQVWGGFRVGKRANTRILRDEITVLEVEHDGYKSEGVNHIRRFDFSSNVINIHDFINGTNTKNVAYFHLTPRIYPVQKGEYIIFLTDEVLCEFLGATHISLEKYQYAEQFNLYQEAIRIVIVFNSDLKTIIRFKNQTK